MKKLFIKLQNKLVADGSKSEKSHIYFNKETGEIVKLKNKLALRLYAFADGMIFGYWGHKDWGLYKNQSL